MPGAGANRRVIQSMRLSNIFWALRSSHAFIRAHLSPKDSRFPLAQLHRNPVAMRTAKMQVMRMVDMVKGKLRTALFLQGSALAVEGNRDHRVQLSPEVTSSPERMQ